MLVRHDDVIKWKHFPRYWPFVRGIHRSQVNSPHKGQWRKALMFSLICAWINGWVKNSEAGDLRRHRAHYDFILRFPCHDITMFSARYFRNAYVLRHLRTFFIMKLKNQFKGKFVVIDLNPIVGILAKPSQATECNQHPVILWFADRKIRMLFVCMNVRVHVLLQWTVYTIPN